MKTLPLVLFGSCLALASVTQAATLIGSFELGDGGTYNLTEAGNLDWAYWNTASDPFTAGTTNSKLGGTLIANPTATGGGVLRGSTSDTDMDVTYSDGTTVASGTTLDVSGIFNSGLGVPFAGLSMDITLPTAGVTYYITVWGSEYATETTPGIFTASLSGATDYTYSAFSGGIETPKDVGVYSIAATADTDNATLNITYVLPADAPNSGNRHVLFDAVAVSSIPEPGTYAALLGLATLGLVALRRRRK